MPDDFLKAGFGDCLKSASSLTIGLLAASGRHADAMLAAERARGRAFVDLLASKDITIKNGTRVTAAAVEPAARGRSRRGAVRGVAAVCGQRVDVP